MRQPLHSALACLQLERADGIQEIRDSYLRTLVAPMDGMWESAVIAHATFWEIRDRGRQVGYFCIDSDGVLLRFHLWQDERDRAQAIFRWVISAHKIQRAIASTVEPPYFSLCLDMQRSMTLHSYLFGDHTRVELASGLANGVFRQAEKKELADVAQFYQTNTAGPGEWITPFLHERLAREELFVLYDQQTMVATGECIPSQKQIPYADLGMVVAQAYRGRGLGSFMLAQLKSYCYAAGWKPICSCAADNHASKRAIEKAGFMSEHTMVQITF